MGALRALQAVAGELPWRRDEAGLSPLLGALVACATPEHNIPAVRNEAARLLIDWAPKVEGGLGDGLAGDVKRVLGQFQEENLMPLSQLSQVCAEVDAANTR